MNLLNNASNWRTLLRIGGIAAILEIFLLLGYALFAVTNPLVAAKPETALEFFGLYEENKILAFLTEDFLSLFIITLYIFIIPALFVTLFRTNPSIITLGSLFSIAVVIACIATESTFSMVHLSEKFLLATTEAEKNMIIAAGEAVIASDMWNSSSGFLSGILLQGSGIMISVVMLSNKNFSKITALSGILANGFDLSQHLITFFAPSVGGIILMIAGPFYLIWYPLMGRDLLWASSGKKAKD